MSVRPLAAAVATSTLALAAVCVPAGTAAADGYCDTTIDQSSVHVTPKASAISAKGAASISVSAVVGAPCGNPSGNDLFPTVNLTPVDFEHNLQWETGIMITPLGAHHYRVTRSGKITAAHTYNADAGSWDVTVGIVDTDDPNEYDLTTYSDPVYINIRRAAQVTANASPEPVKKGKTITVRGKLTRANWDTGHDQAYGKQIVRLQFRTKSGSYVTIKTLHASAHGNLKAKVKATKDGYYRFVFPGTTATASTASAGDYVNVK